MSVGVLDRMITGAGLWWVSRSSQCRWFLGCTLAAITLGVAGGMLT